MSAISSPRRNGAKAVKVVLDQRCIGTLEAIVAASKRSGGALSIPMILRAATATIVESGLPAHKAKTELELRSMLSCAIESGSINMIPVDPIPPPNRRIIKVVEGKSLQDYPYLRETVTSTDRIDLDGLPLEAPSSETVGFESCGHYAIAPDFYGRRPVYYFRHWYFASHDPYLFGPAEAVLPSSIRPGEACVPWSTLPEAERKALIERAKFLKSQNT